MNEYSLAKVQLLNYPLFFFLAYQLQIYFVKLDKIANLL